MNESSKMTFPEKIKFMEEMKARSEQSPPSRVKMIASHATIGMNIREFQRSLILDHLFVSPERTSVYPSWVQYHIKTWLKANGYEPSFVAAGESVQERIDDMLIGVSGDEYKERRLSAKEKESLLTHLFAVYLSETDTSLLFTY